MKPDLTKSTDINERLHLLEEKFEAMGQDMNAYLDGLLYSEYLTYWDYLGLDTLLTLQKPRTAFKDEMIFIMYHQITELYFRLSIHAINQLIDETGNGVPDVALFKRQLGRVNAYHEVLTGSFDIMVAGMDKEEFLKFRMALLPASGFQSAQYRMIEIMSTDLYRLVHHTKREEVSPASDIKDLYPRLYWKFGATEVATGKKTLTLRQFEKKYSKPFLDLANRMRRNNMWQLFRRLPEEDRDDELRDLLREHDMTTSVRWRLAHYRSAVKHMQRDPEDIAATGGTNWQEYLPPKKQRVIYYPELWEEEDMLNWGLSNKKIEKAAATKADVDMPTRGEHSE